MPRRAIRLTPVRRLLLLSIAAIVLGGCHRPFVPACTDRELSCLLQSQVQRLASGGEQAEHDALRLGLPPEDNPTEYRDLRLEDAFRTALEHSQVLRDLGGTAIRAPEAARTVFDPAIQHTDPQYGVDAALSAFDANLSLRALGEKDNHRMNNLVFGENGLLKQDQFEFDTEVSKRTATGGLFAIRHRDVYAADNTPTNQYPSAWDAILEGEVRQPLLQGAGVAFNRLAGPGAAPGTVNGVVIARLRSNISLTEFELGVRDMLSDIENAYWDLYYAYRDLESKKIARDLSLITWNRVKTRVEVQGSEATANEAQAREQYFRFEEEVHNALYGRLLEGTRNNNGSSGGTFRANPGVRVAERRLRYLLGLPESDGALIRPADEPTLAKVSFDWASVAREALVRRPDLRRQKEQIRRRELELVAERNHLLPTLDMVARYRARGFGHDLFGDGESNSFDAAFDEPFRYQDWQLGFEFSTPLGFRRAHAAVRNAQLRLARERALFEEQQRQVIDSLAGALVDARRAYEGYQIAWNRVAAARGQVDSLHALFREDKVQLDFFLEAQRRLAEAQSQLYQTQVEYMLALKNVQFEKGSLLDYCGVQLSEAPQRLGSPQTLRVQCDAAERLSYVLSHPAPPGAGVPVPAPGAVPATR